MGCGSGVNSHGMPTPAATFSFPSGTIARLTCGSEVPILLDNQLMFHRDKQEYSALLRETHPTRCTLTGNRTLVKRTPDETFALSTHKRGDFINPSLNAGVFRQNRLQRLLLHPKCSLVSDPKWGQTKMVIPISVYEAKGWVGDYKEARRQACAGAHRFLNMLDLLARVPGTSAESRRYQTERSHDFQIFGVHFSWRTLACPRRHQTFSIT